MENDKQITQYTKETSPLLDKANTLAITNKEEMTEATEVLSQMNKGLDKIKTEKEKVLKPLREAASAEKARWKPLEDTFGAAVERIRNLMSVYQTEAAKKEAEDKAKIAARVGTGKGKIKAETAVKKMGELETAEDKIEADSGGISFRDKKQLKITDEKKIPKKYWIVDEKALFADLKDGKEVPGAEIEVIKVPINRR